MELEKRKREDNGGINGRKRKTAEVNDGVKGAPEDVELDEFFATLKRMKVAVNYFRQRNGGRRELTALPWSPSFVTEDFDGVKKDPDRSDDNRNVGLDLNADPASDVDNNSTAEI